MQKYIRIVYALCALSMIIGCVDPVGSNGGQAGKAKSYLGKVESLAPEFSKFFDADARAEILANGFEWSEGPLWVDDYEMLLFSDVPKNKIYKWTEAKGIEVFLNNSGYTGKERRVGEMGSNGLALRRYDELVICQHGDKHVSVMAAPFSAPRAEFIPIAERFGKIPFNSPNDLHIDTSGCIYFTDPPYGLEQDEKKVNPVNGIYKIYPTGKINMVYSKMTRPNGIISIPSEKAIIVSNSDPEDAAWYKITYDRFDRAKTKDLIHDATEAAASEPGLPDGMAMHQDGYLFATGPGGVWVFNPSGVLIGKIKTNKPTSNCTFDKDYGYLYMTADDQLLRIAVKS